MGGWTDKQADRQTSGLAEGLACGQTFGGMNGWTGRHLNAWVRDETGKRDGE